MAGGVLVFDSGLGGLSVRAAIRAAAPHLALPYVADNAAFPYGGLDDGRLVARVLDVIARAVERLDPALLVIACNTASTLVLPELRTRWGFPVVGTVPAIKPAARMTRSGLVSVLATPATVARDYTASLVREHAGTANVTLVGAPRLAAMAERVWAGEAVDAGELAMEIRPAFVEWEGRRTDTVVLACTHYPLIADRLVAAAPWPVAWVDPAPAIARRVLSLLDVETGRRASATRRDPALFTAAAPRPPALVAALERAGLAPETLSVPFRLGHAASFTLPP